MKKHHYVYHSYEEWGRDYIGSRSCDCLPEEDTRYFGSFKDKTFKPTGKNILFVCETRQEVAEIEIILHDFFDVAVNPQFANRSKQTSTKFDRTGVPNSEAQKKAHSERMSGKNNPMFGRSGENHPMFGVPRTEETKKKMSVATSGKTRTKAQNKANSERMTGKYAGEKNPSYGKTGALNPRSKAIIAIEPDNTQQHFGGVCEAARDLKINLGNLCTYLKSGKQPRWGKFKEWQFLFKNSEDS